MSDKPITITIVDVAAHARELYGDDAESVTGRPLPEHDWRLEATAASGRSATFHRGATADDIAAWVAQDGARRAP